VAAPAQVSSSRNEPTAVFHAASPRPPGPEDPKQEQKVLGRRMLPDFAVPLPGGEVPVEGRVALHLDGVGGEEVGGGGGAVALGVGVLGIIDEGDRHGVEGVPAAGGNTAVEEVFAVEVEVLEAGLQAGVGARKR
jgi:hypothetical protein